jgi:hypothetical protein
MAFELLKQFSINAYQSSFSLDMVSADTSSLWTGLALDGIGWWAVQLFHYTRGGHRSFFLLIAYQLIFLFIC